MINHEKNPVLWRARSLLSCLCAGLSMLCLIDLIGISGEVFRYVYEIEAWGLRFPFQTELVS